MMKMKLKLSLIWHRIPTRKAVSVQRIILNLLFRNLEQYFECLFNLILCCRHWYVSDPIHARIGKLQYPSNMKYICSNSISKNMSMLKINTNYTYATDQLSNKILVSFFSKLGVQIMRLQTGYTNENINNPQKSYQQCSSCLRNAEKMRQQSPSSCNHYKSKS